MATRRAGSRNQRKKSRAKRASKKRPARPPAKRVTRRTDDQSGWNPSPFALWSERWGNPNDTSSIAVLLHHPTAPYPDKPRTVDEIDDPTMRQLAFDYLSQANKLTDIGLPQAWLDQLDPTSPPPNSTFRWLPIRDISDDSETEFGSNPNPDPDPDVNADRETTDPFTSFRVVRETDGESVVEAVILLASEWRTKAYLGSEFGIRVVASVRPDDGKFAVCITGMSASLPFGRYLTDGISTKNWQSVDAFAQIIDRESKAAVKTTMAQQLRLQHNSIYVRGVRIAQVDGVVQVERRCTGKTAGGQANATPYSFVFLGTPDEAGVLVSKAELVADATPGYARVFPLDPESASGPKVVRKRRPTRSEKDLDLARVREQIAKTGTSPLVYIEPPPRSPNE